MTTKSASDLAAAPLTQTGDNGSLQSAVPGANVPGLAENAGSERVLFPINRSLDYRCWQRFLVAADCFEEAEEKVRDFVNSDWSPEKAREFGVAQISDEMDQLEDSQAFVHGEQPMLASSADLDGSVVDVVIHGKAAEMFALLKKIAERPQMYHSNVSDLGLETKALVESLQAQLAANQQTLVDVMAQAYPAADESDD